MEETPAEELVFCTLLGPEGPDLPMRFSKCSIERTSGLRCDWLSARREEYRPYFENYTVDASILDIAYGISILCVDITNNDNAIF